MELSHTDLKVFAAFLNLSDKSANRFKTRLSKQLPGSNQDRVGTAIDNLRSQGLLVLDEQQQSWQPGPNAPPMIAQQFQTMLAVREKIGFFKPRNRTYELVMHRTRKGTPLCDILSSSPREVDEFLEDNHLRQ